MPNNEKTVSLEALCLVNMFITKRLIIEMLGSDQLSKEQMQSVFEAAKKEFHRSTLSVGPKEADELFALIWRDYIPSIIDVKEH